MAKFEDQKKKNKKRKARLLFEQGMFPKSRYVAKTKGRDVALSEEERVFNEKKAEMEAILDELQAVDDSLRERYERLANYYDEICRSKYTCLDSLNKCEDRVDQFKRETSDTARLNLKDGIVHAYSPTVLACREKRDMLLVCQALEELGDFHYACGDTKSASRSWNDGIDAIFGALNACDIWRDLLEENPNPTESFGLWSVLIGASILGKLARLTTSTALHSRLEKCRFASRLVFSIFSNSVVHPLEISVGIV